MNNLFTQKRIFITVLVISLLMSSSVFSMSRAKSGKVNIYFIAPLTLDQTFDSEQKSDSSYPLPGGGISYNIDGLEDNQYMIFQSSLDIFDDSLDCENCPNENRSAVRAKIWESMFFRMDENKGSRKDRSQEDDGLLQPISGLDINIVDLYSHTNHIVSLNLLNTFYRSGYLLKLNNDKIIMTGTVGVGGKYLILQAHKDNPDLQNLDHIYNKDNLFSVKGLQIALNAKFTLSIEDNLLMVYKYEVSFDGVDYPTRRISELSAKATPFKAVADSDIVKSLFIGVEHRNETVRILDRDIDSSFNGVTLGVSF